MDQNKDIEAPTTPVVENKQKSGKWLEIATVIACVVAVCSIGFGIYSTIQNSKKDYQITDLEARTADLEAQIIEKDKKIALLESKASGRTILTERAYSNSAWGFQYTGKAIFDDGTIYVWDYHNNINDYSADGTKEQSEEWILEHGTRIEDIVSENEIKEMKDMIENLNDDFETTSGRTVDGGSNYIVVWRGDEKIYLKETGDYEGENKSQEAQDLIKRININLGYYFE